MRSKNLINLATSKEDKNWKADSKWSWNRKINSINRKYKAVKENKTSTSLYENHYK